MTIVLILAQTLFSLVILSLLVFFFFVFLSTWTLAQDESSREDLSFRDIVSLSAIEWGSHVLLFACQWAGLRSYHEAPPINRSLDPKDKAMEKHLPILLIPSLHSNAGIFRSLKWRLIHHSFTSLWPFQFRPFLEDRILLKEDLREFIRKVQTSASSHLFRLVSFGSSRPLVAEVINEPEFKDSCLQWICLSGPMTASKTFRFLKTSRLAQVFLKPEPNETRLRVPDLLIRGKYDSYCYPASVYLPIQREVVIEPLGHYGILMHPKMVQAVLAELGTSSQKKRAVGT